MKKKNRDMLLCREQKTLSERNSKRINRDEILVIHTHWTFNLVNF